MNKNIPFVPNELDDMHCMQAAYMMIAKYFDPSFDIAMDEWSRITAFDKSTWASAGLLWFKTQDYDVKHITMFDYPKFIINGGKYLEEISDAETAGWQIANSNIPAEITRAKNLLASGIVENRKPTQQDIREYLDKGYLLRALVNSCKLNNKPGYVGHAVVLFDYDQSGVIFHDPGLPPRPNRKATWQEFEAAWAYPTKENKELDAIKR